MRLWTMIDKVSATPWVISINQPTPEPVNDAPAAVSNPASENRWTIKRLLDWTTDFFRDNKADHPRLEAEILLAEALGCERIQLYTRFDEEPDESTRGRFRDWVSRHAKGEPVAYLVGHREFFSLKFLVNSSVLIPRPETEHVVSEALDYLRKRTQPSQVVDVGTGSGNIIVAIAKHAPAALLTATDISAAALDVARSNAELHKVQSRIQFIETDLLEGVSQPAMFDLIVSNPPYIGTSEKGTVQPSVANFEPHTALFSGPDGCETIERLIDVAAKRLVAGGRLIFELSPIIAARCHKIATDQGSFTDIKLVKDYSGHQRVLVATKR